MIIRPWRTLVVALVAVLAAGCGGHAGEDGHAQGNNGGDGHGQHKGEAHSAGAEPRPSAVVTRFNEATELFLEYPALVVGKGSRLAAHLSWLADYRPVTSGRLTVTLERNGDVVAGFRVGRPTRGGLYTPTITPREAGEFDMKLTWEQDERRSVHMVGDVQVYADRDAVPATLTPAPEGGISFLKEQQWQVPFNTAVVAERRLRASVPATGTLKAVPGRDWLVRAPVPGRVQAPEAGWPEPGQKVQAGETVARIVPRLGTGTDVATLRLAVAEAEAKAQLARRERRRLKGLLAKDAVPERRVIEARNRARIAQAQLRAARQRLAAYQQPDDGARTLAAVPVIAGTAGTVASVSTGLGASVDEGAPMLRVVDRARLRLEARVPESTDLRQPTGAWYTPVGADERVSVDPSQDDARLVSAGEAVNETSRTIPITFEVANRGNYRVGTAAQIWVWTGAAIQAPAVPVAAVQREAGETVVYLLNGGETFERRVVRLGKRAGDFVEVKAGLERGERVVTEGSYLVRLAASGGGDTGHGHAH